MSDLWLNIIGLSLTTALFLYGFARLLRALKTGIYTVGGGIYIERAVDPGRYTISIVRHVIGMIVFGAVYFGLLYNKFVIDIDWMSR